MFGFLRKVVSDVSNRSGDVWLDSPWTHDHLQTCDRHHHPDPNKAIHRRVVRDVCEMIDPDPRSLNVPSDRFHHPGSVSRDHRDPNDAELHARDGDTCRLLCHHADHAHVRALDHDDACHPTRAGFANARDDFPDDDPGLILLRPL